MTNNANQPFLTPPEVAKLLRVSQTKVLGWIRRAELRAVNVGNGSRPRYRVSRDAFDELLQAREVQPPSLSNGRQRRQSPSEGGPLDPVPGEQLRKKGQAEKVGST
ncbi:MAG: helix-turn-helix domain-containing protein [Planctomycetes bacterium]|nr:helix-turn-helix domain-containing protein [Planctomycetota bacterium]